MVAVEERQVLDNRSQGGVNANCNRSQSKREYVRGMLYQQELGPISACTYWLNDTVGKQLVSGFFRNIWETFGRPVVGTGQGSPNFLADYPEITRSRIENYADVVPRGRAEYPSGRIRFEFLIHLPRTAGLNLLANVPFDISIYIVQILNVSNDLGGRHAGAVGACHPRGAIDTPSFDRLPHFNDLGLR